MLESEAPGRALGEGDPAADQAELRAVADRARDIVARSAVPAVVTLGGDGTMVLTPDGPVEHVPLRLATLRDTTGAGDTFNGVSAARGG